MIVWNPGQQLKYDVGKPINQHFLEFLLNVCTQNCSGSHTPNFYLHKILKLKLNGQNG